MRHRSPVAGLVAAVMLTSACGMVAGRDPVDLDAQAAAMAEDAAAPLTVELARFFGDCEDTTLGVTDVTQAASECEVIQILTNKFNAENDDGIDVQRLGGAQFAAYYDTLNATSGLREPQPAGPARRRARGCRHRPRRLDRASA